MENARPYWKVIVSLIFSLVATAFVVIVGVGLIRFLMPFVIGWIISCIANPVVCWLDKKLKIQKKFGSALMIIIVIGAVVGLAYLIVSLLVKEMGSWVLSLPQLYTDIGAEVDEISKNMSGLLNVLPKGILDAGNTLISNLGAIMSEWIGELGEPTVSFAGNVAKQIPALVIGTFVTILSAYFFVADRESVLRWFQRVIPEAIYQRVSMALSHFKYAVGGYFMAQFKIMIVVCVILFVGLCLLRVEYAIVLSILIGFLDFLPFFGTGTAFIPWCIYTLLTGDYLRALFLAIIYAVTQVFHQMIQPKLIGDEVGLKPLPTLILIYIGYKLGGVLWMILSVPLGMILINMFRAGAFDYILNDVRILAKGIRSLRE